MYFMEKARSRGLLLTKTDTKKMPFNLITIHYPDTEQRHDK